MIISVNWLKKFVDIDLDIDDLTKLIGSRLVEIERVINLNNKYKDVVIAKVVEVSKLDGSDHLNVTKIDDGGKLNNVARDDRGFIQVVCGADNVTSGINIAWLPPESIVPNSYETDNPFTLRVKDLRGVTSNGMIASARELDLYDEHDGILVLDDNLTPGDSFATVYELDDYLLDIENKSLTHRPDVFGIIGFAREVAAILGREFKTVDWLSAIQPDFVSGKSDITMPIVKINDANLSSRFQIVALQGVDVSKSSPIIYQTYLARVGMRPINALVDATNYMMMLTGQPLGIYDYDKVMALADDNTVYVRAGKENEKLELLDGRVINLSTQDIVISAGNTNIGLAGAMGGKNTVVDASTKNIMIESASFNLYNLRSTQMRHGIFSEAITRFTKGQPPELTAPVLAHTISTISDWAGYKAVSGVVEDYPKPTDSKDIDLTVDDINAVLGSSLTADEIKLILTNAEFIVNSNGETLVVTPPYWRSDIHIPEDIIEEVGRLGGYDNIEQSMPTRNFRAVGLPELDQLRNLIRNSLVRAGANEVLTYSFIHGEVLKKAGQLPQDSYRIVNSISPDLQYYRQSLTPSLLQLGNSNIKSGYDNFALFEINKVHPKQLGLTDENVPVEASSIALIVLSKDAKVSSAYYDAKKYLDFMAKILNLDFDFQPIQETVKYPTAAPFEYRRSAIIIDKQSQSQIGMVGEYRRSVRREFKLPEFSAGFEINTEALLLAYRNNSKSYRPSSRFPSTERDLCFQVDSQVNYQNIIDAASNFTDVDNNLVVNISPVDIYQADTATTKNITIRLNITPHAKTMTGEEIATVCDMVIEAVQSKIGAVLI